MAAAQTANREYGLSGERCQETLDFIRDRIDTTLAFLMGTFELVFRANLDPRLGFFSSR
jgi:hypothetical protein